MSLFNSTFPSAIKESNTLLILAAVFLEVDLKPKLRETSFVNLLSSIGSLNSKTVSIFFVIVGVEKSLKENFPDE